MFLLAFEPYNDALPQFFLLLVLFVKPMLASQGATQSGGAVYRKVVIRNIVCISAISVVYLVNTVVMVFALENESPHDSSVRMILLHALWFVAGDTSCTFHA